MNDRSHQPPVLISIAAVERDTGLSKDTLRVWERRYGFPKPERDAFGDRVYPLDQIDKLRVIKRLMDAGHRPGKIMDMSIDELQVLSAGVVAPTGSVHMPLAVDHDVHQFLAMVKSHRIDELRRELSQTLMRLGLGRFVTELVAPLNEAVGDAWLRGYFEIFEEHLYTESMQVILRNAINNIPRASERPRILLTTFPQEQHGLGLLIAEALFSLEGCRCVSLGTQTPIWDIVRAANAQRVDVVALSCSSALNPNHVLDAFSELRRDLSPSIEIWAGGGCPVLHRKPLPGITVITPQHDATATVTRWRETHAPERANS